LRIFVHNFFNVDGRRPSRSPFVLMSANHVVLNSLNSHREGRSRGLRVVVANVSRGGSGNWAIAEASCRQHRAAKSRKQEEAGSFSFRSSTYTATAASDNININDNIKSKCYAIKSRIKQLYKTIKLIKLN
jgi:hypothetical protein